MMCIGIHGTEDGFLQDRQKKYTVKKVPVNSHLVSKRKIMIMIVGKMTMTGRETITGKETKDMEIKVMARAITKDKILTLEFRKPSGNGRFFFA